MRSWSLLPPGIIAVILAGCGDPIWDPAQDSLPQFGELLWAATDHVKSSPDGWICQLDRAYVRIIATKDRRRAWFR